MKRVELIEAENLKNQPGPEILTGEIMYDHKGFYWKCDGLLIGPFHGRKYAIASFKCWSRE